MAWTKSKKPDPAVEHVLIDCGSAGRYVVDIPPGSDAVAIPRDDDTAPRNAQGGIYGRTDEVDGLPVFRWRWRAAEE